MKPLTFQLVSGPPGASLNPSDTSATIVWTPGEADGPGTFDFVASVTDSLGGRAYTRSNRFQITVREVNLPPVLIAPPAQSIDELSPLRVSLTSSDPDIPANSLTYSLVNPPAGASIDSTSGEVSWTPDEAQGPGTIVIDVKVEDDGLPPSSATMGLMVTVKEVNAAPTLQPIPDQKLSLGEVGIYQVLASDVDLPANTLTFRLDSRPDGMTIDEQSGEISWTPGAADIGVFPITVSVTDDGSPNASATTEFQVTVSGEPNAKLDIQRLVSGHIQLVIHADPDHTYEIQKSADVRQWQSLLEFPLAASPHHYIDPESTARRVGYYRVRQVR